MSDRRLRELEREVTAGEPGAEAEWLRARVQAGELARARLELAARLDHGPALAALEARVEAEPLRAWLGFPWPGRAGEVRVRIALTRPLLAQAALALELGSSGRGALQAAEGWLLCPCHDHAQRAGAAGLTAWQAAEGLQDGCLCPRCRPRWDRWPATLALAGLGAAGAAGEDLLAWSQSGVSEGQLVEDAVGGDAERADAVRAAVRRELVPWLLGHGDPVLDRAATA